MLTRNEIRDYALQICLPVLERAANRSLRGDWSFKPDQVGYVPAYLENICRPFWGIAPLKINMGRPCCQTSMSF